MPVVKLYANLRRLAGVKEISVCGANLGQVVFALCDQVPLLEAALLESGQLRPHLIVTLNGVNIHELDTPITEQDQIAIFPPLAGG